MLTTKGLAPLGALALALATMACSVDPQGPEPTGTAASPLVVTGLFATRGGFRNFVAIVL